MTRQISFGGVTTPKPGAYSKVDFSPGAQPSSASVGIVGIVGEADLGVPNQLLVFDDEKTMRDYFGSGALADAARAAFRPSTDPLIPGGSSRVFAYKTNQSTASKLPLHAGEVVPLDVSGTAAVSVTSATNTGGDIKLVVTASEFAGLDLAGQTVEILTGKGAGQRREIISHTGTELIVGSSGSGLEWSPIPDGTSTFKVYYTQVVVTSANRGELMNSIEFDLDSADGQGDKRRPFVAIVELLDDLDLDTGAVGTPMFSVQYENNLQAQVPVTSTATSGSVTTVVDSFASYATDEHKNRFVKITGAGDNEDQIRKIASNDGTTLTVTNDFSATAITTETFEVRHGIIDSSPVASATSTVITLDQTTANASFKPFAGELDGLQLVVASGAGSGQTRRIASNTTTAITVAEGFSTPLDSSSVVEVHYVSQAVGHVSGNAGVSTNFKSGVVLNGNYGTAAPGAPTTTVGSKTLTASSASFAADDVGKFVYVGDSGEFNFITDFTSTTVVTVAKAFETAVAASGDLFIVNADLDIDIPATDTVQAFQAKVNANSAYVMTLNSSVNPQTTFVKDLDFDANNQLVSLYDDDASNGEDGNFTYQLHLLVQVLNNSSGLVTAERSTSDGSAGSGLPDFITAPLQLQGASRGTSANSNFQSGFDAMLLERINHVVPAMSADLSDQGLGSTATIQSVAQMTSAHVSTADLDKNERTGFVGFDGTKTDLIRLRGNLSNLSVQLVPTGLEIPNAAGNITQFGAWSGAVAAAAMRAGGDDQSFTNKQVITNSAVHNDSWDPRSKTDVKDLLLQGILFFEPVRTGGFKWVRDLTTDISQENLLINHGAVVWNWKQVVYNLRTDLEEKFTGVKATRPVPASVKNRARRRLRLEAQAGRLTGSNENGVEQPPFEVQKVTITDDIIRLDVKLSITAYGEFILIDNSLEIPRLEA